MPQEPNSQLDSLYAQRNTDSLTIIIQGKVNTDSLTSVIHGQVLDSINSEYLSTLRYTNEQISLSLTPYNITIAHP